MMASSFLEALDFGETGESASGHSGGLGGITVGYYKGKVSGDKGGLFLVHGPQWAEVLADAGPPSYRCRSLFHLLEVPAALHSLALRQPLLPTVRRLHLTASPQLPLAPTVCTHFTPRQASSPFACASPPGSFRSPDLHLAKSSTLRTLSHLCPFDTLSPAYFLYSYSLIFVSSFASIN